MIFAAVFGALFLLTGVAGAYSGGDGSVGSPYQISNNTDLMALSTDSVNWGNNFILTDDIDLTGYSLPFPIGTKKTQFNGSFDGRGYTIRNFEMHRSPDRSVGFFGYLGTHGMIMDLGIEAGANGVSGESCVGVLVGWNDGGSLDNCYATGSATANEYAGGLVGVNFGGSLKNCYATGSANADDDAGGLVGYNFGGSLENCYATGNVNADDDAGGLVGYNFGGSLENCYATGNAAGYSAGGLVGYNTNYDGGHFITVGTITNCYATGNAAGGLVGRNQGGSITNCYRYTGGDTDLGTHISDLTKFRDYAFITGFERDNGLNWPMDIIRNYADLSKTWRVFTYKCQYPIFQWQSVETGTLQVKSAPEGATVLFNGVNTTAVTNHIFSDQPAGAYNITVVRAGYTSSPEYLVVNLTDGETKEVTFSLKHETGGLQINSTPSGADIYLDGILNAPVTNATLTGLVVGTYNVTVVLNDYETVINDTVMVTSDATTSVFFALVNQTDDSLIDPTPYHHVSDGDDKPTSYVAQTSTPTPTPVPTTITPTPEANCHYTTRNTGSKTRCIDRNNRTSGWTRRGCREQSYSLGG